MPELLPEDQERVDAFLSSGVNDTQRKPFKPLSLLVALILVLALLSFLAYIVASGRGVV